MGALQRWGSTPKGELFDDVADGTSFGLTTGLIAAASFTHLWVGIVLGGVYVGATVYRLIRFVVEKRKQGILGGVTTFSGMPSPGAALMVGTTCVFIANDAISGIIIVVTALLMVSRVPYAHFGRSILPKIPKVVRVLVLGAFLFLLALGVHRDHYTVPLLMAFVTAVGYMASPLFWFIVKNRGT